MKQLACLILLFALALSGCADTKDAIQEPVTFYYLQEEYQFGTASGVFGTDERDAYGHRDDLRYLMALYLMGPAKEGLRAPMPLGTHIFSAEHKDSTVYLKLSNTEETMTKVEFSLACACLSMTCMDLTGVENVTISSGERVVTMNRNNLILFDGVIAEPTEEPS